MMHAQLAEPPPALTERRADLAPAVNQVFATAMAKVAADRFPTCRHFALALREALGLAARGVVGHPATEAVVVSATSLPAGEDAATQAVTPRQPVPFQQPPMRQQLGAERNRPRISPVLLGGASIVLAAGIVAAAIIIRSHSSTPSSLGGASSPPHGSSPASVSQAAYGQAGYRLGGVLDPGAQGSISSVAWNPAGTLVATSDKNGSTYVWDVKAGRQDAPPLAGPGKAYAAAFSPDGTELATGYSNGTIYLWDYKTGQLLARLRDPGNANGREVDSVVFSPDGGTLATGDYEGHVYIWDVASGTTTATFALAGGNCPSTICAAVSALAFSRGRGGGPVDLGVLLQRLGLAGHGRRGRPCLSLSARWRRAYGIDRRGADRPELGHSLRRRGRRGAGVQLGREIPGHWRHQRQGLSLAR